MLELLHIENVALIEQTDIHFYPGFNVLTGETGAGKSIIIDALGAVLGQRTSRDLIRTGAEKAFVAAEFSDVGFLPVLEENGIAPEDEGILLLQREMYADGKNICRINGRPVTVTQLRQIGAELLNIHGQHDGQQLLDEQQHGLYLDNYGRTQKLLEAYQQEFYQAERLKKQIDALRMDETEKARRVDMLQYQIQELEAAQLENGEEESLLERRNILRNSEKFMSAVEGADACLSGDGEENGAVSAVQEAQHLLGTLKGMGESFQDLSERLGELYYELNDVAETVRDLKFRYEFSPEELDQVERRCDQLYRLKKKYGASVEDMLEYLAKSREELEQITSSEDTILCLEKKLEKQWGKTRQAALLLSERRKTVAGQLEERVQQELRELDMPKVRFAIELQEQSLDASGMDRIRFLMSANVGEALKPIHKIASGGELARIMLAMKNVLAEQDHVGTLVFDEVDTGVSGRAAQKVAEKLAQVSRRKQVLCVTHLPQLAAMADVHFSVAKGEEHGRTYTYVATLDRKQRQEELARLTGGSQVTSALLSSAGELLDQAAQYKKETGVQQ